jgi:hypothetical protein
MQFLVLLLRQHLDELGAGLEQPRQAREINRRHA